MPVLVGIVLLGVLYSCGAVICVVLSSWRIGERDYGSTDRDGSKANLTPALDIFYTLVICQAVLYFLWLLINRAGVWFVYALCEECKFPVEWGRTSVVDYLYDTRAKCWKDPASIGGKKLINYAVDSLGSESWQDYLSGVRMLDVFIEQGVDVRLLLLPSRPKVQKLIDTLGWRSSGREMREVASRIVACLAGDIHLDQFPGAIRCISSLLDTTLPYSESQQGSNQQSSKSNLGVALIGGKQRLISRVKRMEERHAERTRYREGDGDQQGEVDSQVDGQNELILQGLTILEKLASDQHNCRDICSTPDLLPKIMAPLYSNTLIHDINKSAWADIVNGSLKVVHRLMRAPECTGRRLPCEISTNMHAVGNLERILDQDNAACQELKMRAMEILTELALDPSVKLSSETQEKLIRKQMEIFLTHDQGEDEPPTRLIELKVTAGKTLALLSKAGTIDVPLKSEYNSLTEILDAKNKIIYRTIAAEMLENLCTHHTMDRHMKDTLLPKVLTELLTNISAPGEATENQELSAPGNDEENQAPRHNSQIESFDQADEEHTAMMELQEGLLSLTLVICDKHISADDFGVVVQRIAPGEGEFVAKLKALVEKNCQATANCLRIVKLCGQIALLMMSDSWFMPHSKGKEFVESLSKASEIMSSLESCMVFTGIDCGAKKTVRPLLSDIEEDLKNKYDQLVRA